MTQSELSQMADAVENSTVNIVLGISIIIIRTKRRELGDVKLQQHGILY